MRTRKWVSVLYCPGTNCEQETLAAFQLAGARAKLLFLADLLKKKARITDCDLFCVPGGFSFGDYIKEGIIAAIMLEDFIPALVEAKIPSIWICNGCQIGGRLRVFGQSITLTRNLSGVFMSRPVEHLVLPSNSIWTKGLEEQTLAFPSAHGGGYVVCEEWVGIALPNRRGSMGNQKQLRVPMIYKSQSPNGGPIAAISSENGLALGIMDHPERPYGNEDGQKIFRNGLAAV
jgi:phosphoribosylformylglycinamidine synthase